MLRRLSLAVAFIALAGCTSHTETFPGKSRDQVWTALMRTAEAPDYDDWHVVENQAFADENIDRIEVWRLLRRYRAATAHYPYLQDRDWTFSVQLEETDPPSATITMRSCAVPAHAWTEEKRYFDQVWTLLGGRPEPAASAATKTEAESKPESQPQPQSDPQPTPQPQQPDSKPEPAPPPVDIPGG